GKKSSRFNVISELSLTLLIITSFIPAKLRRNGFCTANVFEVNSFADGWKLFVYMPINKESLLFVFYAFNH
ncbi:MAG: hypothetical protein ABIS01_13010, partial [Ferruginibacter sp.]